MERSQGYEVMGRGDIRRVVTLRTWAGNYEAGAKGAVCTYPDSTLSMGLGFLWDVLFQL